MTTLQKCLVLVLLVLGVGVGTYQGRQAADLRAQVKTLQQPPPPPAGPAEAAELSSLQARIERFQAENSGLAKALAQVKADQARLETERDQARHTAALFKELADQADAKDKNGTNDYPTVRHVWTAWGRLGRLSALVKKDDSKLSPEEKAAKEAARMQLIEQIPALLKAFKQFEKAEPAKSEPSAEEMADNGACLLYGALNLDEQQFGQAYGVIQKYQQLAKQKDVSNETPTSEKEATMRQVMEQFAAEVRGFLSPDQSEIFAEVATHLQVTAGGVGFNVSF